MDAALANPIESGGATSSPPAADAADDRWAIRESDVPRRLRLAASAVLPALALGALVVWAPALPHAAQVEAPDAPIEALLVDAPPPPPEPTPTEPSPSLAAPAPGPRLQRVEAPRDVPTAIPEREAPAPSRAEQASAAAEGPRGGGGDPGGTGAGTGAAAPAPPTVAAAPPRPPRPAPIPEEITQPKAISMKSPSYPSAAKSAGIEGTVVIGYVVGESGAVTEAHVVRGPPELAASCLDAVKSWRFTPAESGGRRVAAKRSARFPFRLKT